MDFCAWDRACLAKLESCDALNQLILPPAGQPTGAGPAACGTGLAPPALGGPSAGAHDRLPTRGLPSALPTAADGAHCACAGYFHVHNNQTSEFRRWAEAEER